MNKIPESLFLLCWPKKYLKDGKGQPAEETWSKGLERQLNGLLSFLAPVKFHSVLKWVNKHAMRQGFGGGNKRGDNVEKVKLFLSF